MTVERSQITGPVMLPDGSAAPDGTKIIYTLPDWDKTDDAVILSGPKVATIEDGVQDVDLHRVSTGDRQIAYKVSYTYYNADQRGWVSGDLGTIAPSGPGPYQLADLLSIPVVTPTAPDVLAQALAAVADARLAAIGAADAAADAIFDAMNNAYADVATGLAAVAEGEYFWAPLGDDVLQQYRDVSGVAVLQTGVTLPLGGNLLDRIDLKADATALAASVADLEGQIDLKADATALAASVTDLEGQIDLKADATALAAAVTGLEGDIDLKADATALAASVTALEGQIDLKADATALAAAVAGLEGDIDLKADATALAAAVTGLEGQIDLKADATALAASVADLEGQIDRKTDLAIVGDFITRGDDPYLIAFAAKGAGNDDVILGGFRPDGAFAAPHMQADKVTTAEIVMPGLGTLYDHPTREDGLFAITDANGVVKLILGAAGQTASVPADDIRAYQPLIIMDGVADQSTQLKAAHDAAAADGLRHLYIEGPIYAPSALFLGDVQFLSRTGKGRLIGTYRKRVVPVTAPSFAPRSGVVPQRHLSQLRAKLATATPSDPAIVVFLSDSWGNANQLIGWTEQFEQILQRVFWQQFGPDAANIRIVNRAIGGTVWADANAQVAQGSVPWATGVDLPWTDYVTSVELPDLTPSARTPDLTMCMFGQNYASGPNPETIGDMEDVLSTILTDNPTTDIVLICSSVPSAQSVSRGTVASLEARQSWAAYTMAVAEARGYGRIDFAQAFDAAHWGFDPRALHYHRIAASGSANIPWTFPEACNDFAFRIEAPGATSTFWTQGDGILTIPLSAIEGNALILDLDASGNIAFAINAATGVPQIARTVTAVDGVVGTTTPDLEVCALGSHLTVRWRTIVIYSGPVVRGWQLFTPSISYGGGGTMTASLTYAAVGEALSTMPSLTDQDAWGDATGDYGGNQENHYGVKARAAIFGQTLEHTNFGG